MVCKGDVKAHYEQRNVGYADLRNPHRHPTQWELVDYNCEGCGLMYSRLPPKKAQPILNTSDKNVMERLILCEINDQGDAWNDAIDDAIDEWHTRPGTCEHLHDHLGMSWDEYRIWVQDPGQLRNIVNGRRNVRVLHKDREKGF